MKGKADGCGEPGGKVVLRAIASGGVDHVYKPREFERAGGLAAAVGAGKDGERTGCNCKGVRIDKRAASLVISSDRIERGGRDGARDAARDAGGDGQEGQVDKNACRPKRPCRYAELTDVVEHGSDHAYGNKPHARHEREHDHAGKGADRAARAVDEHRGRAKEEARSQHLDERHAGSAFDIELKERDDHGNVAEPKFDTGDAHR